MNAIGNNSKLSTQIIGTLENTNIFTMINLFGVHCGHNVSVQDKPQRTGERSSQTVT
jgi:hypothetical protein